jgi:ubiquinone/menaquinone biosynthesis C-methylase UbiE
MVDELKKKVVTFWKENLCGKHFINAPYPSKEFFEQYSKFRYRKEHHLNHLIDWQSAKGKDFLEIGVGIGTDGARWAQYSKSYIGIDLTDEAIIATTQNFNFLGVRGIIIKADAEMMPFRKDKFDIVYSHGVLHHTPNIEAALRETYRILKSNGELILMLYSKDSFNY